MGYFGKKKEWDSGVEYDKVSLMKMSSPIGCLAVCIVIGMAGWAIWHFGFSDNRLEPWEYKSMALVFGVAALFLFVQLCRDNEQWYVDYEGFHVHITPGILNRDADVMISYKWTEIWDIQFKFASFANDEYTNEGDKYAAYKIIIDLVKGEKITRLLGTPLNEFKAVCRKYYGRPHRWFAD